LLFHPTQKAVRLKSPFAPPAAALMRNVISRKENFIKSKDRNINGGGANAELISTLRLVLAASGSNQSFERKSRFAGLRPLVKT
jgi:hypothetical protein